MYLLSDVQFESRRELLNDFIKSKGLSAASVTDELARVLDGENTGGFYNSYDEIRKYLVQFVDRSNPSNMRHIAGLEQIAAMLEAREGRVILDDQQAAALKPSGLPKHILVFLATVLDVPTTNPPPLRTVDQIMDILIFIHFNEEAITSTIRQPFNYQRLEEYCLGWDVLFNYKDQLNALLITPGMTDDLAKRLWSACRNMTLSGGKINYKPSPEHVRKLTRLMLVDENFRGKAPSNPTVFFTIKHQQTRSSLSGQKKLANPQEEANAQIIILFLMQQMGFITALSVNVTVKGAETYSVVDKLSPQLLDPRQAGQDFDLCISFALEKKYGNLITVDSGKVDYSTCFAQLLFDLNQDLIQHNVSTHCCSIEGALEAIQALNLKQPDPNATAPSAAASHGSFFTSADEGRQLRVEKTFIMHAKAKKADKIAKMLRDPAIIKNADDLILLFSKVGAEYQGVLVKVQEKMHADNHHNYDAVFAQYTGSAQVTLN